MFFTSGIAFACLHISAGKNETITTAVTIATYFFMGLLLQHLYTKAKDINVAPFFLTYAGHTFINLFVCLSVYIKSGSLFF